MGDRALINQSYGGRQSLLDGEAIQSAMGGAQGSGGTPTPSPTFTTQPAVSPSSGTAGATTFTAIPGTVSNGSITSRAWLLNGSSISTGTTAAPATEGTLTYQEFATGAGGSASSALQTVTVAASGSVNRPATARPATHSITSAVNMMGDSTINGTGAPSPSGAPWFQMRPLYNGAANTGQLFNLQGLAGGQSTADYVGNGGVGGENSAQGLTRVQFVQSDYPAQLNRTWIFSFGLNDYLTSVTPNPRPWADSVRTNYAAMAAIVPVGKLYLIGDTMAENSTAPGQLFSADHVFHRRDMLTQHGARAIDLVGALRLTRLLDTSVPILSGGADERAIMMGSVPYSYRGTSSYGGIPNGVDYTDGDYVPTKNPAAPSNTTDLAYPDGALWYVDTNAPSMYRKTGANGAGGWAQSDGKHNGRVGYGKTARIFADAVDAFEAKGPPFAPPQEFRCPANATAGTIVGTLAKIGTPTVARLDNIDGTPSVFYSLDTAGVIRRIGATALPNGEAELTAYLGDATGGIPSLVRIFTVRPAGVAPTLRPIASPGVSLAARTNHGIPDTTGFAIAIHLRTDVLTSVPVLALFSRSGTGASPSSPGQPLLITGGSSGALRITTKDNTDAFLHNAVSTTGASITAGVPATMFLSIDYQNNIRSVLTVDAAGQRVGALAAPATTGTLPFADCFPRFLCGAPPTQFYEGITPLVGGIGYLGFWSAPVDWSIPANWQAICNADGSPKERTAYSALPSGPAPKLEMFGLLGDWLYGTPDGSNGPQTMALTHRARTLMS